MARGHGWAWVEDRLNPTFQGFLRAIDVSDIWSYALLNHNYIDYMVHKMAVNGLSHFTSQFFRPLATQLYHWATSRGYPQIPSRLCLWCSMAQPFDTAKSMHLVVYSVLQPVNLLAPSCSCSSHGHLELKPRLVLQLSSADHSGKSKPWYHSSKKTNYKKPRMAEN